MKIKLQDQKNPPSVPLSQKQELAVCKPAPFFCMITQVTEKQTPLLLTTSKECENLRQKYY